MKEIKNCTIGIKITKEKKQQYEAYAKLHNMSLGELIRNSVDSTIGTSDLPSETMDSTIETSPTRDLRIPVTNEEFKMLTTLASESGVSRTAFVKNRILNPILVNCNINLNLEALNEILDEYRTATTYMRNIHKTFERAGNQFTEKEKQALKNCYDRIENISKHYFTELKFLQIDVKKTADKAVREIISKKLKKIKVD